VLCETCRYQCLEKFFRGGGGGDGGVGCSRSSSSSSTTTTTMRSLRWCEVEVLRLATS